MALHLHLVLTHEQEVSSDLFHLCRVCDFGEFSKSNAGKLPLPFGSNG